MPLQQLHQAFLTFFNALAPAAQATFRRPYLSRDGKRILYPQFETQTFELSEGGYNRDHYYFAPLADAVHAVQLTLNGNDIATPSQANLLLLMRFFNRLAISMGEQRQQLLLAPFYCMQLPDAEPQLFDMQTIAAYVLKHSNHPTVRNFDRNYLIPVHILFNAIQVLACAINEIEIDTLDPTLALAIQNENFDFTFADLQELVGLPSIQEQTALWQLLSPHPRVANIFQAVLTDPHVIWQMAGILSSLFILTFAPSLDPRFLIAFNLAWETLGIWLFSQDNLRGTLLSGAYIGILLLRALIQGFVHNPHLTPISSTVCQNFTDEQIMNICGHMLRGLNFATLDRERLLMPPVMTWLTKKPLRFMPTVSDTQLSIRIHETRQRIRTLTIENRNLRN